MFYVNGVPRETALGVPVFDTTWDLNGALKYAYHRYDVRGLPIFAELTLRCTKDKIVPLRGGAELAGFASDYGKTYFVNGLNGAQNRIDTVADCRSATATSPPNPAL